MQIPIVSASLHLGERWSLSEVLQEVLQGNVAKESGAFL